MIDCLLIANRGEIAIRVALTASRMGVRTVGIYTPDDRSSLHVRSVDVAVEVGDYLDGPELIAVAQKMGAQAVHPGVGFLAERADFASAVAESGLIWVGPRAQSIKDMGCKAGARRRMKAAGVSVLEGYDGADQDDASLLAAAVGIGFPVVIKPSAGGGGKGMQVVNDADAFLESLASAQRVAKGAFGDARVVIERFLSPARHIEVQILADQHGRCVHLLERDCSIQRRHQKVVEEAPSAAFSDEKSRAALFADAVRVAETVSYVGAGTVEFVVDSDGQAFFLEMNTRLQVEHPVTEAITGIDLVEWQLRVACGEALPFVQSSISSCGWAMEARLYAEQPREGHIPSPGVLHHWSPPEGVRVDAAVESGSEISSLYDPMLAKIIATGDDRAEAARRLGHALDRLEALGVHTNRDELRWAVRHPDFLSGNANTDFLRERPLPESGGLDVALCAVAAFDWASIPPSRLPGLRKNWRSNRHRSVHFNLTHAGASHSVSLLDLGDHLRINERTVRLDQSGEGMHLEVDGVLSRVAVVADGDRRWVKTDDGDFMFVRPPRFTAPHDIQPEGAVLAPMAGTITKLLIAEGEAVRAGQSLMVIEAMKMEQVVTAPSAGTVDAVRVQVGRPVDADIVLLLLKR